MGSPASGLCRAAWAGGEQPAPAPRRQRRVPSLAGGGKPREELCGWASAGQNGSAVRRRLQEQNLPPVLPRAGRDLIAASSEFPCTVWV